MNKPNPLVPLGTFPDKGKAQVRITVFAILAIHVVLLGVLLIAGCNKKSPDQTADNTGLPPIPPVDTNWPTATPPPAVADTTTLPPPVPPPTQDVVVATPPQPPPPETPAVATLSEHTISKGESFYTLGKKYGVGFKAIADANPTVNPNRLKIGDKIKIPPPKTPGAAALTGTAAPVVDGAAKTYKVRSGDNLGKIGKQFGVTPKQLRAANNLKTDQIKVGQTLKIPAKEVAALPPVESIPPVPAAPPSLPPTNTPQ